MAIKIYIKKKLVNRKFLNIIRLLYPISMSKLMQLLIMHKFNKFGNRSSILYPSVYENKNKIKIGDDTAIGAFVHIWGGGGVSIGNRVLIASHVSITSLTHDYTHEIIRFAPIISKEVKINDDVWIGSHAVILPGVEIGKGAVIGAGAVVSKNVPAMAIALGVPAKVVKFRHNQEES